MTRAVATVRRTIGQCLKVLGYRVLECGAADEALSLWPERRGQVALLLTDMVLPGGMTGLEMAQRLRQNKPGLKVIIMSGYSEELKERGMPTDAGITYLSKPFQADSLGSLVRARLDEV